MISNWYYYKCRVKSAQSVNRFEREYSITATSDEIFPQDLLSIDKVKRMMQSDAICREITDFVQSVSYKVFSYFCKCI